MLPRRPIVGLALASLVGMASVAHAQDSSKSPIRLIVPFGPGSTPDLVARLVGERLGARLGKTIIVENKTGSAGNIGIDAVAKAAPDGQTIGVGTPGPLAVNALLFKRMPYDPARDIEPVAIVATQPAVLVVSNKLGVGSPAELLALLRKQPGKFSFASIGAGSASHLALQTLSAGTAADLVHVPYTGSGAAVTAVISGEVDMAVLPAAAVMPHVKAGKIKSLAIASARRSPLLPGLPTLAESGVQEVQADAWIGFVVPARTPPAIVKRLQAELAQILAEPALKEKLALQYMEPVGSTPEDFRRALDAEVSRWKPVIQAHNIKLD
jgi:tripartite-type tricarboxylate transporter receptor subunit TctC